MPDQVPTADNAPIVIEHFDHRRDVEGDAVVASENPVKTLGEMLRSFPDHFEFRGVRVNDSSVSIPKTIKTLVDTDGIDHVMGDLTDPDGTTHPITHEGVAEFHDTPKHDSPDEDTGSATDTDGTSPRSPGDILQDNARLYAEKNDDYGSSWTLAGETMSMWAEELGVDSIDPSDPEQAIIMGLYWERLIKLIRGFNLELNDETPNNEPTTESHADASTYAAMHASLVEKRKSDDE